MHKGINTSLLEGEVLSLKNFDLVWLKFYSVLIYSVENGNLDDDSC